MEQREITDQEGITWTCVQAYAAGGGARAEKAARLAENKDQEVPVICTPGGGAQTVRLRLPANWMEGLSDKEILDKISENKEEGGAG